MDCHLFHLSDEEAAGSTEEDPAVSAGASEDAAVSSAGASEATGKIVDGMRQG